MTTKTQAQRVINALENGAELTAKQITARYGVKNVLSHNWIIVWMETRFTTQIIHIKLALQKNWLNT